MSGSPESREVETCPTRDTKARSSVHSYELTWPALVEAMKSACLRSGPDVTKVDKYARYRLVVGCLCGVKMCSLAAGFSLLAHDGML